MAIRVEVCRFCRKIGWSGLFFLKNGLEFVICLEKWVGVGGFYQKNGWEWVVILEKWVGMGHFS